MDAFRDLLDRAGLFGTETAVRRRLRPFLWMGSGGSVALAFILGTVAVSSIGASGRIAIQPTVSEGRLSVDESTDFPDGALLAVEVYRVGEWQRFIEGNLAWSTDPFTWLHTEEVRVRDGAFRITADLGSWSPVLAGWSPASSLTPTSLPSSASDTARTGRASADRMWSTLATARGAGGRGPVRYPVLTARPENLERN